MQFTYNSTIIQGSSISLPDYCTVFRAIIGCVCRLKDLSQPYILFSCRIHPPYFPKFTANSSSSASVSTPLDSPSANLDRSDPSRSKLASKPGRTKGTFYQKGVKSIKKGSSLLLTLINIELFCTCMFLVFQLYF